MKRSLTIVAILFLALTACKKETKGPEEPAGTHPLYEGTVTMSFDARVGNEDFVLNKTFTINNRFYYFGRLRYWVSNVVLINVDGSEHSVPKSYYLIQETNQIWSPIPYPAKKREDVTINGIPAGNYKAVRFSIGVDSIHNSNLSLQDGELTTGTGMDNGDGWTWATSYIFTAMGGYVGEGTNTKEFKVETGSNKNYKTVTLDLPKTESLKSTIIKLNVDAAKLVEGLDLMTTPTINHSTPAQMTTVSGNFEKKAFSVASVD
jgi:hypothetical protein